MSAPLTKEQMRNARLAALGLAVDQSKEASTAEKAAPVQADANATSATATTNDSLTQENFETIQRVMYKGGYATFEDMQRWYEQGFCFCSEPFFGLKQGNGGPCGILATIQAEMLREMLFSNTTIDNSSASSPRTLPSAAEVSLPELLASAVCSVLQRAAAGSSIRFASIPETCRTTSMHLWNAADITITTFVSAEEARRHLAGADAQALLASGMGCVAVLLSLVCTRSVSELTADMDDAGGTLIGQFGHCNQELINLLLTGRATSNVIDGEMELGESGLRLRGVYKRNTIGYLTQLEALRYCEVGSYLKVPQFPIWVVGSSSHFSVLFSLDRQVNEESAAQKLRSTLQRSFKAQDRAECGFIAASAFKDALENINLHGDYPDSPIQAILQSETDLARLRGHLQIDGEIILWSSYWAGISSLMSGKSLDELISIPAGLETPSSLALIVPEDSSKFGTGAQSTEGRMRSDSELAREMQAELDGEMFPPITSSGPSSTGNMSTGLSALDFSSLTRQFNFPSISGAASQDYPQTSGVKASTAPAAASAPAASAGSSSSSAGAGAGRPRSDSEIARELQAEWDREAMDATETGSYFPSFGEDEFSASAGIATRQKHSLSMDVQPGAPEDYPSDLPDLIPADAFSTPNKKAHTGEGAFNAKMPADAAPFPASSSASWAPAAERSVERFDLFHFNGLESSGRSARLTAFQLFVRSSDDAVGMDVAFEGGEHSSAGGIFGSPMEEVLRTRWPGCTVSWHGQAPPSID